MASVIDICNVALGHLGNSRRIASIDPPDGSAEADYAATFYPIALAEALEMSDWSFARKRQVLGLLSTNESSIWAYAYAKPSDCLVVRRIPTGNPTAAEQDTEPFDVEGDVIYTNKAGATLVYTRPITDPAKFTPSFVSGLGYLVGSYMAGPIIKGAEGAGASQSLRKVAASVFKSAITVDANKTNAEPQHVPSSILARNGAATSVTPSSDEYTHGSGYGIV